METKTNSFEKFFGVVLRGQTYLNMLYLLLSFPLGIVYFVFLVVGFSVGMPLIIIWIGILIMLAVFAIWYALLAFERNLAIWLLHEDIPPMTYQDMTGKNLWQKFTATAANPVTWKGLVYLLAKFPLGLLSFIVLVTLVATSAGLIAAPFYYVYVPAWNIHATFDGTTAQLWMMDTLGEALVVSLIGILLGLISLHILNGLAWISGKFARVMLGNFSDIKNQPKPQNSAELTANPPTPAPIEQPE